MRNLFLILLLIFPLWGLSQNTADSLNELLKIRHDSLKPYIYSKLSYYYLHSDNKLSEKYADSTKIFAEKYNNQTLLTYSLITKGTIYSSRGNYAVALNFYEKAEILAKKNKDFDRLNSIYNDMGVIYRYNNDNKTALKYYNLAIENAKKLNNNEYIANTLINIGNIYTSNEDFDNGKKYYDSAFLLTSDIDKKSAIFNNIAYIQINSGDLSKARETYNKALDFLKQKNVINHYAIIQNNLIDLDLREGKYQDAENRINFTDSICTANSLNNIRKDLYYTCYELYSEIGNFEMANKFLFKHYELKDSIYNLDFEQKLNDIQNKYKTEKAELKIKNRDEKIKQQKIVNSILTAIILLSVTFIAIISFLFVQKKRLNKMMKIANENLTERDNEITENLNYAKLIQKSCIKNNTDYKTIIVDMPKVVVGGDFYISEKKENYSYFALADCTGHGVSAGFISILGINSLNSALHKFNSLPEILNDLNNKFCDLISKNVSLKKESLCLSIIRIDNDEMFFSGSKHKLWVVSNNEIKEFKTENPIIGIKKDSVFVETKIEIHKGDIVFLSSDGYPDQFGEMNKGKLKYERFRNILLESANEKTENAENVLIDYINKWKGENEQTDDILVLGIYL